MEQTINTTASLTLENAFNGSKSTIKLEVTVGIKSDRYGWFEVYDIETGGQEYYAEGGLWFDNKELVDYDGVYELPDAVLNELSKMGYDVSEMLND
jgi:hypothetical protein